MERLQPQPLTSAGTTAVEELCAEAAIARRRELGASEAAAESRTLARISRRLSYPDTFGAMTYDDDVGRHADAGGRRRQRRPALRPRPLR